MLVGDVCDTRLNVRRTDGKRSVTALPIELGWTRALRLDPLGRFAFEFSNQSFEGNVFRLPTEDMNVIFYTAYDQRRGLKILASSGQVSMNAVAKLIVLQKWFSVFGGKDDMQVDLSQRL